MAIMQINMDFMDFMDKIFAREIGIETGLLKRIMAEEPR